MTDATDDPGAERRRRLLEAARQANSPRLDASGRLINRNPPGPRRRQHRTGAHGPPPPPRGGVPRVFEVADVVEAYTKAAGITSDALKLLEDKFGEPVSRRTLQYYAGTHPEVKEAIAEVKEATLDLAESELLKHIRAGDYNSIKFYLETQGKHRGYTRTLTIDGKAVPNSLLEMVSDARRRLAATYDAMAARLGFEPGGDLSETAAGDPAQCPSQSVH